MEIGYIPDPVNRQVQLSVIVTINKCRLTVGRAVELGLMYETVTGGFDFNARRIRDTAYALVDELSGIRSPGTFVTESGPANGGLSPRQR